MAFKLIPHLLIALTALLSFSANSAIVTHNLFGKVVAPVGFFAIGAGTFSYDDAFITGSGVETINTSSSLTIEFTIFGQTFTETDDVGYFSTAAPDLKLIDGVPVFLNFLISEVPDGIDLNVVAINEPGVVYIDIWDPSGLNLTPDTVWFEVDVSVGVVPVPAAIWLFGSGLLGLISIARRKKHNCI